MVPRSEWSRRSLAPHDNSTGSVRSQRRSPGAFCAFICIAALWIKASVFMAIFFFCALIDPFQHGWNRLIMYSLFFFFFNSVLWTRKSCVYWEDKWQMYRCIVLWPSQGGIAARPFAPLYLSWNLFEGMKWGCPCTNVCVSQLRKKNSTSPFLSKGFLRSDFMDSAFVFN